MHLVILFKQEVSQPNSKHLFHEYLNQIYPTDTFLDWDTQPGSPAEHKRRWKKVLQTHVPIFLAANLGSYFDAPSQAMKESMVMILIHHIANLLLLVPLFVTGLI